MDVRIGILGPVELRHTHGTDRLGSTKERLTLAALACDAGRPVALDTLVERLWDELREASPGGELVAEGRIVMAGAMADRGDVRGAIALLEKARTDVKRPRLHHLRLWYALADLYERAGEIPHARELFRRVLRHDRDFADVAERLSGLD